ncbi:MULTISPECIES: LCP family protein [Microbacterium]|uniref:LCP family protein n=1 Tax=Microbacterium TaxID=33882 RepID=UPI00076879E7|nr:MULTISPECIES: LCP family protein [Microbacterium]KXC06625.1 transcriptional regulator [Microbacterium hominis]QOC24340.1 LCP family protein [Microbacterium hominis]QOC28425.1 LCP family protein [Microbacterium hominis]QYF96379.1 LCP family protein [Microbacterium sp. PAMC21962]
MSPRPERPRRQPVARHGILKSPHPLSQVLAILAAVVAVAVISTTAVGAFYVWDATRAVEAAGVSIGGDDEQLPPTLGEIEGGVNMLVVGTDSCEGDNASLSSACQNHDTEGERNDVTMLVHISDEPRRVTVVSFPRDMIVPIPSCTGEDGTQYSAMSGQMLNSSYMYGGLSCTVATIKKLTGIDIQFAAATRWTGVINMSDAIGGVDVCVADDIFDAHTGLNLTKGDHTLTGVEALQFLRTRYAIGDGSDLGRISNQQQFLSSLVRKLQSEGVLGNPATLLNLANTALQQVTSDPPQVVLSKSLANPQKMVQIAMAVRSVPYQDIVFVQYPTVYAADGLRVDPVTSAAKVLFDALANNQPIQLTGSTSDGYGTEVVGEATPTPSDPATPEPTATADAGATAAAPTPTQEAVQLPSSITGQTAAQVTCTVAQR